MERGRCISAGLRHWLSDGYIMYVSDLEDIYISSSGGKVIDR